MMYIPSMTSRIKKDRGVEIFYSRSPLIAGFLLHSNKRRSAFGGYRPAYRRDHRQAFKTYFED